MEAHEDRVTAYIDGMEYKGKTIAIDMNGADFVEVQVDHAREKLWINTSKGGLLRLYGMRGAFQIFDLRYGAAHDVPWVIREILWAEKNGSLDALRLKPSTVDFYRSQEHLLKKAQHIWTLEGLEQPREDD